MEIYFIQFKLTQSKSLKLFSLLIPDSGFTFASTESNLRDTRNAKSEYQNRKFIVESQYLRHSQRVLFMTVYHTSLFTTHLSYIPRKWSLLPLRSFMSNMSVQFITKHSFNLHKTAISYHASLTAHKQGMKRASHARKMCSNKSKKVKRSLPIQITESLVFQLFHHSIRNVAAVFKGGDLKGAISASRISLGLKFYDRFVIRSNQLPWMISVIFVLTFYIQNWNEIKTVLFHLVISGDRNDSTSNCNNQLSNLHNKNRLSKLIKPNPNEYLNHKFLPKCIYFSEIVLSNQEIFLKRFQIHCRS